MISWKQYLRSEEKPAAMVDALLKTVHLLLEALRLHAVESDQFEYEKFQADMQKLHDSLGERPTSAEILVTTGAAIKGVEEYNRHASRFLKQQGLEYQAMMGMLAEAIAAITQSLDGERHVFAVAFVVQRLALINGRFGPGAGESMMAAFTQHLNEKLSAYTMPAFDGMRRL